MMVAGRAPPSGQLSRHRDARPAQPVNRAFPLERGALASSDSQSTTAPERRRFSTGKQCEGTVRNGERKGHRCLAPARRGRRFCRVHGGNTAAGIAHHHFSNGSTSKYWLVPGAMADAYEAARNNPDLTDLRDHIALTTAQLATLVRDMSSVWDAAGLTQTGPNPKPAWLLLRDGWEAVLGAKDATSKAVATARFGALVNAGARTDELLAGYMQLMEQLRRLADTQLRREEKLGQFIPVDQVRALARAMGLAVQKHVSDRAVVGRIQAELQDLVRPRTGPSPPPPNGAIMAQRTA